MAVDPTDPDTVYLGDAGGTNYKSTDGGVTWAELTLPTQTFFGSSVLEIAPSDHNVIYATEGPSLLRSDDAGATWHGTNGYTTNVEDITVHPTDPDTVYVATTFDKVQGSTDGGQTWTTGTGLPDLEAYTVEIDRSQPTTVYAGTARAGYLYRSIDAGTTWQPYRVGIATGAALHVASGPAGVVYAGTEYHGVFHSADPRGDLGSAHHRPGRQRRTRACHRAGVAVDGVRRHLWRRCAPQHRRWPHLASARADRPLRPRPGDAQVVVAHRVRGDRSRGLQDHRWRQQLATDHLGGRRCRHHRGRPVQPGPCLRRALAGCHQICGRWADVAGVGRSQPAGSLTTYRGFAVHPTSSARVWVGSRDPITAVLRSTDGGRTWRSANTCPMHYPAEDLTVDPRQPWIVYAGCESQGVYQSLDRGVTWRRISSDAIRTVTEVVVDPADSRRLYVGTYTGTYVSGVYRSTDRGATWTLFSTGMTTTWTHALTITSTSSALHAGTTGYGVSGSGGGVFTYPLK